MIEIEDAYRIGQGQIRLTCTKLKTVKDKCLIFKNTHKLKEIRNSLGKPIYVNNHLPDRMNQQRHRNRYIINENRRRANPYAINAVRVKIPSNNEIYKKRVHAPMAEDVPEVNQKEKQQLESIRFSLGSNITQNGNVMFAYATEVNSLNQVRVAYRALRLKLPRVPHIICSYRLPGQDFAHLQDFQGDEGLLQ